MRRSLPALLLIAVAVLQVPAAEKKNLPPDNGSFLELPYLQLGDSPTLTDPESYVLMWQTSGTATTGAWSVEVKTGAGFRKSDPPKPLGVRVPGADSFVIWEAKLSGLQPGGRFDYRVLLEGKEVFAASATGRTPASKPYKFIAWGDAGANSPAQKRIAAIAMNLKPDFVFITGDIVYSRGLVHEYRTKHFPIYNAPRTDPKLGAPLIRSIPFIAAPGNHDIATRDLGTYPDGLAYFRFWRQPLNGPDSPIFGKLEGPAENQQAFRDSAAGTFSRMANFSFDWGNAHWLVLDTNSYVNWADADLQKWIAADLDSPAARNATWRFVGFHHPGFNSSHAHFKDQQARVLSRLFEAGKVDVVFAGHVHNYQRSFPLKFVPNSFDLTKSREVNGAWALDRAYDGKSRTKPDGIIYLVTGAGGNRLYDKGQQSQKKSWQEFTAKFISKTHSLTSVEIDGGKASFRQINRSGKVIDEFVITK